MHPLTTLVCGNASASGAISEVNVHLSQSLDRLFVKARNLRNNGDAVDLALFGPVIGRAIVEVGITAILARFDPFRVLSIRRSQLSPGYDIAIRNPLAFNWTTDVQGEEKPKDWALRPGVRDLQRAALCRHYHDVFWQEAFTVMLDSVPYGRGSSWMSKLKLLNPEGFTAAMRVDADRLYSELSKGIHHEFVIPIDVSVRLSHRRRPSSSILGAAWSTRRDYLLFAGSQITHRRESDRIVRRSARGAISPMTFQGSEKNLVLAAEDFESQDFQTLHKFSSNDERVISKLVAHGPVLLQGSRGSGKSALMREAAERLPLKGESPALGVYISLRHMPLLRSVGDEYQRILCELLIDRIDRLVSEGNFNFSASPNLTSVQRALADLAQALGKRIVLMFDDAAHIGREASLADFFDVFRTLGSSTVSCKATIYPGVTNFGSRFDVYNDASVIEVIRDETQPGFAELFTEVVKARYPDLTEKGFTSDLPLQEFAGFVAKSVLGNMRSFIFACNDVANSGDKSVGLSTLSKCFLEMTMNFYWPLIDEVRPKLGKYVPIVGPAKEIAEALLLECGKQENPSVLVHRDLISRLAKAFEILEYAGFIAKRESSKAMKSGGRGSRYAINLCMLLENVSGARLTADLFRKWKVTAEDPVQIHSKSTTLARVRLPELATNEEPEILADPIETLQKSLAHPYGLSERMVEKLHKAEIHTVRDLYEVPEEKLDAIDYVGEYRVKQLKNVVAQAIWL